MKQVTHEDLKLDRRVTRTEESLNHNKENIDVVYRYSKFTQAMFFAGYISLVTILIGQFYFIYSISEDNQRQFGEVKHQIVEVRAEVADNRRLIEENSVRLDSLTAQVGTLTSEAKVTNERLDNIDGRLAVVEDALTINHQASAHYQVGKL